MLYAAKHGRGPFHPVDVHVGRRVRLRRTLLGMSQEDLGTALSLTFQQIQKYERGANRMGSSRLFQLSQVLDVPVSFFFDDMPSAESDQALNEGGQVAFGDNRMSRRETLELVRAYYRIEDPEVRKRLFELFKAVAPQDRGR